MLSGIFCIALIVSYVVSGNTDYLIASGLFAIASGIDDLCRKN